MVELAIVLVVIIVVLVLLTESTQSKNERIRDKLDEWKENDT